MWELTRSPSPSELELQLVEVVRHGQKLLPVVDSETSGMVGMMLSEADVRSQESILLLIILPLPGSLALP